MLHRVLKIFEDLGSQLSDKSTESSRAVILLAFISIPNLCGFSLFQRRLVNYCFHYPTLLLNFAFQLVALRRLVGSYVGGHLVFKELISRPEL
jgi:hypothetical protein